MARWIIPCERSGKVRDALRALGHDAWSCDLEPCEGDPRWHIQGDALEVAYGGGWDAAGMHPECRYLCGSGIHWNRRRPERAALTEAAVDFVFKLWASPIPVAYLENSTGILSTRWRKPDQIVQPYQFGEDASKATAFWLRRLPVLQGTKRVVGRFVTHNGKLVERWANQTDSGQNRLGPSATRSMDRARTYQGIADAIAAQWGPLGEPGHGEHFPEEWGRHGTAA